MHDAETQKNVDMVNLNAELSHACSKGDVTTVDTTDDGGAILSRPQFWFIGVVANRREQKIAHRIGEEFADVEAYVPVAVAGVLSSMSVICCGSAGVAGMFAGVAEVCVPFSKLPYNFCQSVLLPDIRLLNVAC